MANNPSLLTHDGKVLKAKIDFLLGDMCVKPLDIVHSSVFHVDIASIKVSINIFRHKCTVIDLVVVFSEKVSVSGQMRLVHPAQVE